MSGWKMSQNIQSSVPTDKDIMGFSQFLLMVQREDLPRAFLSRRVTVLVPTDQVLKTTSSTLSLSSPRAKRAVPKGLRAESARAVTGRRFPHRGKGEDFLTGQQNFFTETAVTPERKVEKSFPRWEINRHAEG